MTKVAIDLNGNEVEVSEDTPVKTVDGVNYLHNQEDTKRLDEKETEWLAKKDERQKKTLRQEREPLLKEADIQIFKHEDKGVDASAWREYREALRNITDQPDLFNISFPVKPQII